MPAKPTVHATIVEEADDPGFADEYGGAFDAVCECGWAERRSTRARAEQSAAEHASAPDAGQ